LVAWHIIWLSQKRNKLESKSKKCIFIGLTKRVKSFKLWVPETRSAFTSKDVVFNDESMLQDKSEKKNKAQGGASDSLTDTQKRELSSQKVLKDLTGQKRTQIQMKTNKRLLKSNLDR